MSESIPGFIYVIGNKCYPFRVFKIGRTNSMDRRMKEHQTPLPYPVRVKYSYKVLDAVAAENAIHTAMENYKFVKGGGKEFFKRRAGKIDSVCKKSLKQYLIL